MNNSFVELSETDLTNTNGGLVILGVTITTAVLIKAGVGAAIGWWRWHVFKGIYDGCTGR